MVLDGPLASRCLEFRPFMFVILILSHWASVGGFA